MKRALGLVVATLFVSVLVGVGCGGVSNPCQGTDEVSLFCDFKSPEDLEVLPGGTRLLVSEYGGLAGKRPGTITLLDIKSGDTDVLYPHAGATGAGNEGALWGDPSCQDPIGDVFAPHGIHLTKGPSGVDRLLVVNHAKRESVEMFELTGATTATPTLRWRGCVVAPEEVWLNDVAGLPGGGFVASHMMKRGTSVRDLLELGDGELAPTGYAVEWSPGAEDGAGWKKVSGSDGVLTNGVQSSKDGAIVYVNYTLGNEVTAIDRATGRRLWTASVPFPDNTSWAPDGRLLVASIRGELETIAECVESDAPFCGIDYAVVAIDPGTGTAMTLAEGGGPPFGLATVAVQVESTLYLGSAAGERVGVVAVGSEAH